MNEAVIRERLAELCDAIGRSPVCGNARDARQDEGTYLGQIDAGPTSVDDALNALRLQIKYLVFDLEATRRENHYLRKMLDGRSKRRGESPGQ